MNSKRPAQKENRRWLPLILIASALAIWGLVLAWGAYSAPVGAEAGQDGRKLLMVAATTGGFLMLWGAALYLRNVNGRRRNPIRENNPPHDAASPEDSAAENPQKSGN